MGTGRLLFCFALSLGLISIYCTTPTSAIDVIDNLNDLKNKTNFDEYLSTLCWLLSLGKIDQNGKLRLNINPTDKHLGIHQFKNFEKTFPNLFNTNFEYYTFGNVIKALKSLPSYIIRKICNSQISSKNNLHRIVIQIDKDFPNVVVKVYVTQHYKDKNKGSSYDPKFTFEISIKLLKEIEEICLSIQEQQTFQRKLGKLQNHPHVHWLVYIVECNTDNNVKEHTKSNSQASSKHSQLDKLNLELQSTPNGQARIVWDGIPDEMLSKELKVGVYGGEDEDDPLVEHPLNGRANGVIDTDLDLRCGLQLRLLVPVTIFESVYESPEFDGPEGKVPAGTSYTLTIIVGLIIISIFILIRMRTDNRPKATPHFVTVSHGRPGF
ncbi:hypothetical protein C0J50_7608 [Silurus asotus]|uniref:Uncharacterized protein n=1 Tax=Silurus asotus TaxID=30991 RepID=A0AAD5FVP4_SILAS|nr:hypothetical protein C0J50_7608 [Silurus asotus]